MITTISEGTRALAHNLDDLLERWHIRRSGDKEKSYFGTATREVEGNRFFDDGKNTYINNDIIEVFSSLKKEELLDILSEARINIAKIKDETSALFEKFPTGFIPEISVLNKIKKQYGLIQDCAQSELAKRRKIFRDSFCNAFQLVARENLPEDVFNNLIEIARNRASSEVDGEVHDAD